MMLLELFLNRNAGFHRQHLFVQHIQFIILVVLFLNYFNFLPDTTLSPWLIFHSFILKLIKIIKLFLTFFFFQINFLHIESFRHHLSMHTIQQKSSFFTNILLSKMIYYFLFEKDFSNLIN